MCKTQKFFLVSKFTGSSTLHLTRFTSISQKSIKTAMINGLNLTDVETMKWVLCRIFSLNPHRHIVVCIGMMWTTSGKTRLRERRRNKKQEEEEEQDAKKGWMEMKRRNGKYKKVIYHEKIIAWSLRGRREGRSFLRNGFHSWENPFCACLHSKFFSHPPLILSSAHFFV